MEILRDTDPFSLFQSWLTDAEKNEINDPNAMALATVGDDGRPSVRMVLLKSADQRGFRFFTNMESRKGRELAAHPVAALCFHWKSLQRQVRIEGDIIPLPESEADAYFQSRHPQSRLGAWASRQSREIDSRETLLSRVEEYKKEFGDQIPRPAYWGGYLLVPNKIEFWQQGDFRLHDRFLFTRRDDQWDVARLSP